MRSAFTLGGVADVEGLVWRAGGEGHLQTGIGGNRVLQLGFGREERVAVGDHLGIVCVRAEGSGHTPTYPLDGVGDSAGPQTRG